MVWALAALVGACVGMADSERSAWWVLLEQEAGASMRSEVESTGASIRAESRWLPGLSVWADAGQRGLLSRLPGVVGLQPVASFARELPVADPFSGFDSEAALAQLNVLPLLEAGWTGAGVRAGVLDSGFRLESAALAGLRVGGVWDFVHGDNNAGDEPGQDDAGEASHGAQTLSIMAGRLGDALVGLAPEAEYFLAKTEDVSRNGRVFEARVEEDYWVAGLEWCVENGCRVVNSSLSYRLEYRFEELDGRTSPASAAALEALRRGVLLVNAAGNVDAFNPEGFIAPPGDSAGALTVGASLSTGEAAAFSSSGPTADGRVKPDVLAPGVGVAAASFDRDGEVAFVRGTSASSALVAGSALLLAEAFPSVSGAELLEAFRASASHADAPGPRRGYGLADVWGAYGYLQSRLEPSSSERPPMRLPLLLGSLKGAVQDAAPENAVE